MAKYLINFVKLLDQTKRYDSDITTSTRMHDTQPSFRSTQDKRTSHILFIITNTYLLLTTCPCRLFNNSKCLVINNLSK